MSAASGHNNCWWCWSEQRRAMTSPATTEQQISGRRLRQLESLGVEQLKGIGPARTRRSRRWGLPRCSISWCAIHDAGPIGAIQHSSDDLVVGEEALVNAVVRSVKTRSTRSRRTIVNVTIGDESGELLLTFFNQPYRKDQLHVDDDVVVFGKPEAFRKTLQMTNPIVDLVGDQTGRIIPIYPSPARPVSHRVTCRDTSARCWIGQKTSPTRCHCRCANALALSTGRVPLVRFIAQIATRRSHRHEEGSPLTSCGDYNLPWCCENRRRRSWRVGSRTRSHRTTRHLISSVDFSPAFLCAHRCSTPCNRPDRSRPRIGGANAPAPAG